MDNGLTTMQFVGRCALFSLLWISTIFGLVYSLANIDATLVMALFACSAALVYLLSWVLLHQQFVGVRVSITSSCCCCLYEACVRAISLISCLNNS